MNSTISVSMMLRAGRLRQWREGRGRTFYAPLDTPLSSRVSWRLGRWALKRAAGVTHVEVEGMERLRAIKGDAGVLAPNHPTNLDPLAMVELSRRVREPFNYLASRESFAVPGLGWMLQKAGAYSIMRGTVDRSAIKATRSLLAGARKIVMFPEGLTYGQNETLMPFHEGVAQFGFWALEDLAKEGLDRPVWYVPVGLRYSYAKPMGDAIVLAIWRLEKHLGIPVQMEKPVYERLRTVGEHVVAGYEKAYGVRPEKEATLDARIQHMKNLWVARTAAALGLEDKPSLPLGDRIREIVNALDRMTVSLDASEFTKQTMRRRHAETEPLYRDLERAGRFLATGAHYVAEKPTDERYLEVISRIEEELFGYSPMRGPRTAHVRIGEPIDLRTFLQEYRAEPRATVTAVTKRLEKEVRALVSAEPPAEL